ncbi:FliM/FliN family flagellar motor switch protein [Pseudomonas sp. ZM23]|uniref:FliM/FliN family flagellar motor switch protein n=1 Tax=Pseudomonas triclosanedens TaxID=2961893 RepID=A0ABY6ZZA0_9PSED|nr:FliM/FliN family flagellar motor switch protein [Pseudomonas triclosanedens]MCP8462742.1 FliM/FliN family flagellar motor switch protein [Pseudomonas triclosanedens]MCP8468361.1 FliM/FliN family flagellar motor switch protein [Pseudomonas triclosanedens]MCP8475120.1 FliM/FliN family flagellar motor switch protein [Pseudomonas triclosanedens]WAI49927.1 FliM/FliN family flagellar motor switch protein [Pseudomonas triclosanedens]
MTGKTKVHQGVPADSLIRLKPQKLGRHYHKIPQYIKEISGKYPRIISDYFLRNYRINLELDRLDVHEELPRELECLFDSPLGKLGFAMDRALLTEVIECYYGGTVVPNRDTPPISTSEQRMLDRLGLDVVDLFGRALLAGESVGRLQQIDPTYEEVQWEYVAEFSYTSHLTGTRSSIYLYLDNPLVDELTRRLAGPPPPRLTGNPVEHIMHLPLRLDCVIAAARMPLSQVLGLAPGDVLLIRPLDRVEVRINQQKLFRGAIFEDDGTLFLSSLESVKNP